MIMFKLPPVTDAAISLRSLMQSAFIPNGEPD